MCVCVSLPPSLTFSDSVSETLTASFILMQPAEFCWTKMPSIVMDVRRVEKLSLADRPSVGEANNGRRKPSQRLLKSAFVSKCKPSFLSVGKGVACKQTLIMHSFVCQT